MAPPAQAQLGFEPAEGPFESTNGDGAGDDWVSLILTDVGADADADNALSVASLSSLPLPDLDDLDFSNIGGSANSHGISSSCEQGSPSHPDVLFDPSEILQDMEICPSLYHPHDKDLAGGHLSFCDCSHQSGMLACPNFSQFSTTLNENAISPSPESGLSHVSSEHCDADINIPVMDSCSDEDSFYFLVSDIYTEETSSTKACNLASAMNTAARGGSSEFHRGYGTHDTQGNIDTLQSSRSEQEFSVVSDKSYISANKRDINMKRKHFDRMSRSTTPEGVVVEGTEKPLEETEVKDEEDERRQARLMRNRESAQLSRQRKKIYVDELEEKMKTMASTIAELNNTISLISAENINLRRQLGMFGLPPGQAGGISGVAPWMGAYPPGSMVGNRFMMPGAQVPLVAIPRWKSQQATSVKKTRKPKAEPEAEPQEKGGVEKAAKKTKKVAGVAAAGLFFFVFILLPLNLQFLGLRPTMQRESKVWPTTPWHMETRNGVIRAGGRVLTGLNEDSNLSSGEQGSDMGYIHPGGLRAGGGGGLRAGGDPKEVETCDTTGLDRPMNASIPLAATLFVPRNDQLVRIQGNLIINSVLAGNKAADFQNETNRQSVKKPALYDRSLALTENLKAVALKAAPEEKGALVELQKALAGRLRSNLDGGDVKPVKEDGSLQQWFVEDFTGPIFSSGMCTEVFQFETSPAPSSSPSAGSGSHVRNPNDMVKNQTAWLQENGPRKAGRSVSYSGKSASYAVPLPPVGHKVMFNSTNGSFSGARGGYKAESDFAKQKHASSSVVVSVLAGPELGEQAKLTGGRKLSRIFVVVLIDSIKYVTYSCMLPSTTATAHYEVVVV